MKAYNLILTAAGVTSPSLNSRLFSGGKSQILINGKTIIDRVLDTFPGAKRVSIAVNDDQNGRELIEILSKTHPHVTIVLVPEGTKGALASACYAAGSVDKEEALVVANGDVEILDGLAELAIEEFCSSQKKGGTIAFKSVNPRYSYLRGGTGSDPVSAVVEKEVVGELATTGTFMFANLKIFLESAEWCFLNQIQLNSSYFMSSTLNRIIFEGGELFVKQVPSSSVTQFATLEDIENYEKH